MPPRADRATSSSGGTCREVRPRDPWARTFEKELPYEDGDRRLLVLHGLIHGIGSVVLGAWGSSRGCPRRHPLRYRATGRSPAPGTRGDVARGAGGVPPCRGTAPHGQLGVAVDSRHWGGGVSASRGHVVGRCTHGRDRGTRSCLQRCSSRRGSTVSSRDDLPNKPQAGTRITRDDWLGKGPFVHGSSAAPESVAGAMSTGKLPGLVER
jgi:hypothetical protein